MACKHMAASRLTRKRPGQNYRGHPCFPGNLKTIPIFTVISPLQCLASKDLCYLSMISLPGLGQRMVVVVCVSYREEHSGLIVLGTKHVITTPTANQGVPNAIPPVMTNTFQGSMRPPAHTLSSAALPTSNPVDKGYCGLPAGRGNADSAKASTSTGG
jgi:hypothetical protein